MKNNEELIKSDIIDLLKLCLLVPDFKLQTYKLTMSKMYNLKCADELKGGSRKKTKKRKINKSFMINIFILFISAFFLAMGYIFSIATIKIALVSVTSTFRYSVILWGIIYGYFLFDEVPSTNSYIGA